MRVLFGKVGSCFRSPTRRLQKLRKKKITEKRVEWRVDRRGGGGGVRGGGRIGIREKGGRENAREIIHRS